jgi:hypothetical protein
MIGQLYDVRVITHRMPVMQRHVVQAAAEFLFVRPAGKVFLDI